MHKRSAKPTSDAPAPHAPVSDDAKSTMLIAKLISNNETIAQEIIFALHQKHAGDNSAYVSHLRAFLLNFRKNPALTEQIANGEITPEDLVEMKVSDLASDAVKKHREAVIKEAEELNKPLDINKIPDSATDVCRKCKSRKIVEALAQTRSADEPMTRFLTCAKCGNKWHMSC